MSRVITIEFAGTRHWGSVTIFEISYAKAQTVALQRILRIEMATVRDPFISVTSLRPFKVNPDKFVSGCLNGLPYFFAKIVTLPRINHWAIRRRARSTFKPLERKLRGIYSDALRAASCSGEFIALGSPIPLS